MAARYASNGRKSAASLKYRLAHVVVYFGEETRLSRITTGAIETYKAEGLKAGAKPANGEPRAGLPLPRGDARPETVGGSPR